MKHLFCTPRLFLLSLAFGIMPTSSLYADTPITLVAPNFTDGRLEQFKMAGDATPHEDYINLTRNENWKAGHAMFVNEVSLREDRSFSAYFSFSMAEPNCPKAGNGGDGIAFVLKATRDAAGSAGLGIGYGGVDKTVAVEFDTFFNPEFLEPAEHHIGVNFNGAMTSVAAEPAPFPLNDGKRYHAWIDYDGTRQSLEVRLSNSESRPSGAAFRRSIDIKQIIGSTAYVGLTASTGLCRELHSVYSFYFHRDVVPGGIDVTADSYIQE